MAQPFNIFAHINDLLEVLVPSSVEDRIVDNDAVNAIVLIGCKKLVFQILSIDLSELEMESASSMVSRYAPEEYTMLPTSLYMYAPSNRHTCVLQGPSLQGTQRAMEISSIYQDPPVFP